MDNINEKKGLVATAVIVVVVIALVVLYTYV